MIECKDVNYILAIAKYKTISKAAEALYITQPALTKYLGILENRIQLSLFDRGGKKMTPTPAGELYLEYAAQIATSISHLDKEIQAIKAQATDTLKVAFSSNSSRFIITRAIEKLEKKYPQITCLITECTTDRVEELLNEGEIHIGFISLPCLNAELESEILVDEYMLLGVPASSPLLIFGAQIQGCPYQWINLSYFKDEAFLLPNKGTRFRMKIDELCAQQGFEPKVKMSARNQISAMEFAEKMRLPFFTTDSFVHRFPKDVATQFFAIGTPLAKIMTGVAFRKKSILTPSARDLLCIVKALL